MKVPALSAAQRQLAVWLIASVSWQCGQSERAPWLHQSGDDDSGGIAGSGNDAGTDDAATQPAGLFVPTVPVVPVDPLGVTEPGRLDPDEIYLTSVAQSSGGASGLQVISHWSQPTIGVGFLPSSARRPAAGYIRRTDGRLLYLNGDQTLKSCYFFEVDANVSEPFVYDAQLMPVPAANDIAPDAPKCSSPGSFFMSYDSRIVSLCDCPGASCCAKDDAGTVLANFDSTAPPAILFMDGQGTLVGMNADGSECHVITFAPGSESAPLTTLDESSSLRFFRPIASGFLYGVGADGSLTLKIWRPPNTRGQVLGIYPAPIGTRSVIYPHVDGYGNIYFIVQFDDKYATNVLLRASPGAGMPEKLYESERPFDIAFFM